MAHKGVLEELIEMNNRLSALIQERNSALDALIQNIKAMGVLVKERVESEKKAIKAARDAATEVKEITNLIAPTQQKGSPPAVPEALNPGQAGETH